MRSARATLSMIPWDPESSDHINRLVEQRIACGWHMDKPVRDWKEAQQEGRKYIYWLVLPDDDPETKDKLESHASAFPSQSSPILDTCRSLGGLALEPSMGSFHPVGHIALDMSYPEVDKFNFDIPREGVLWIKSLYISAPLQSGGLGRAAIDALEAMATSEPLSARTLMLDTMQRDDHLKLTRRKMANQDWYERRGYRVVGVVPDYYDTTLDFIESGIPVFPVRVVFMRLDLA